MQSHDISKYDHQAVEAKWQGAWEQAKLDVANIVSPRKKFYNLMMFPYPSAEGLHVGNMYAFTGSDIYGRFKRLQGFEVFEPIGLDGFGIHSENFALKIGRHPVDHAAITEKNFYKQLRRIGAMFDWSRTVETYNPNYYRFTQWLFVQMFKHGLAYRGKAEVNWCPSCKTVLSDEQVIDGNCERCGNKVEKRLLEQWFFRITAYAGKLLENLNSLDWSEKVKVAQKNWIGKKEGVVIHHKVKDLDITLDAFSAYPAWLFADTFLVLAPDHPQVEELVKGTSREKEVLDYVKTYKNNKKDVSTKADEKEGIFTGRYVTDPFTGKEMSVWLANFALMGFGTGIIRCSAHDPRDLEFAKKYQIDLKEVVERDGEEPVNAHENKGILKDSGPFTGKSINEELIGEMVDWIIKNNIGKRETTYHLRDWLISRQRYWGPPIPMIKCDTCLAEGKGERQDMPGWYCQPESELPVILPRIEDYKPGNDGIAPLAKHKEFYETTCLGCGGKAVRETDVSDTFLDSAWYFLRYPSVADATSGQVPFDKEITKTWLPVDMYTGGAEHAVLHLMYARFVTIALHDWGYLNFEEPFTKFYAHGLVIKDGAKMSKSKGNVVNPDEYLAKYGADAFRLYLMFMGPFNQGGDFRDSGMEGMSRWVGRIWRMVDSNLTNLPAGRQGTTNTKNTTNDKVKRELNKLVKKVTDDLEARRYNTAIASMMEFTNLVGDQGNQLEIEELKIFIKLIAPFAPYLAEELWQRILSITARVTHENLDASSVLSRNQSDLSTSSNSFASESAQNFVSSPQFRSVHQESWPVFDPTLMVEEAVMMVVQVNGKTRDSFEMSAQTAQIQAEVEKAARSSIKTQKFLTGEPKKIIFVSGKLINFVV